MKQALRVGLLLFTLLGVALPAFAAPWIDFGMTPGLPGYLQNPGGQLSAWCQVQTDGTTPLKLQIRLFNEVDEQILFQEFPNTDYYYLYWDVPEGLNDGIYHYQVDYISQEGPTAQIRAGFLLAGRTTGLCAFKFIDDDGDGIFDEGTESLASGWEICITGPSQGCKTTDADGVACWFFIPAGVYQVCETMQPGYVPTTAPCQDVQIATNVIGKAIFGNKVAPPTGACCAPDGSCTVLTEADCMAQGGMYYGDGTVCIPNPCPLPTGACCLADGTCMVLSQDDCSAQGGTYYGDGSVCIPNPCPFPLGACCLPSGECVLTTAEICIGSGGTYQGDGTVCDPNPCPPPVGACCLPTGDCIVTNADDCAAQNGVYQGDNVPCDSDPCPPPVPTQRTTWGKIKDQYR